MINEKERRKGCKTREGNKGREGCSEGEKEQVRWDEAVVGISDLISGGIEIKRKVRKKGKQKGTEEARWELREFWRGQSVTRLWTPHHSWLTLPANL